MGATVVQDSVLALTDDVVLPISVVYNAIKEIKKVGNEQIDPLVVTQATSLGFLPVDLSSMDIVVCICKSFDFLGEKVLEELSRVLKPGGQILFQTSQSASEQATTSSLQGKLLVTGFVDLQTGPLASALPSEVPQSFTIKAKKPSWKVGSSFSIKKVTKSLPKVQIDDDVDLIDEDSLLSEEDLKKPQIPSVGDCEVSSTKKACKNCTCGRAEAEDKVQKLGPTMDQLENPQSACGSCGLGDAFRCGTCPYKGLPPFKLGEKTRMDSTVYPPADPPSSCADSPDDPSKEEHVTSVTEDYETTCWGCGLHLTVSPHEPAFICGWCGAITNRNASKIDDKYLWWRRVRDRCFVWLLSLFMLFMICAGVWAIYPVAFSISYICGAFHCSISIILSVATISTYCLAAFRSPGAPPLIPWGSYSVVGRGGLENYTFCLYCRKPKSPRTHHCRSCQMCVLNMDHHCPFIGNCVGAGNHRNFIFFLMSALTSTAYVSIISAYAVIRIWPPIRFTAPVSLKDFVRIEWVSGTLKEMTLAFLSSLLFLSPKGLILVYLFVASVLVEIGLGVLLWQQLYYIYEGKTYLSYLISQGVEDGVSNGIEERDVQNIICFFNCLPSTSRFLPCFWSLRKSHKK